MATDAGIMAVYAAMVSWTYILLTIALIVKIVKSVTGGELSIPGLSGGGGSGEGGGGGDGGTTSGGPQQVQNFRGRMNV